MILDTLSAIDYEQSKNQEIISRMNLLSKTYSSDILGAFASGLCAIHCAITPLFFAARPILESTHAGHHHGNGFWSSLDYIFLVLSFFAVWFSARHTSKKALKWILWLAWLVFAVGLFSELFHFSSGIWLMYTGSFALVIAHIQNYRFCKRCKEDSCST